jgi:hypothetical protein
MKLQTNSKQTLTNCKSQSGKGQGRGQISSLSLLPSMSLSLFVLDNAADEQSYKTLQVCKFRLQALKIYWIDWMLNF